MDSRQAGFERELRHPTSAGELTLNAIRPTGLKMWWMIPGWVLVSALFALVAVHYNVPEGLDELSKTSATYREALDIDRVEMSRSRFVVLHQALNYTLWPAYALAVALLAVRNNKYVFWVLTALLVLTATVAPPLLSTDVYYYGSTGQIVAEYGANPYIRPPSDFPQSQLKDYSPWSDFTSPYGPLWTNVSAGLVYLSGSSPFAASLAFKLFAAICLSISIWLVYRMAARLNPHRSFQATALFAWNPQVLLETAGNAHTEAFITVLGLVALSFLAAKRDILSYMILALSILVKITTLPLLVLVTARSLSQENRSTRVLRLLYFAAFLAIITVLAYLPYWEGLETLRDLGPDRLRTIGGFVPVLAYIIVFAVGLQSFAETAAQLASVSAMVILAGWLATEIHRSWRTRSERLLTHDGLVWGATLVLLGLSFYTAFPWYTVPGLALLAAVWPYRVRSTVLLYWLSGLWFILWTAI